MRQQTAFGSIILLSAIFIGPQQAEAGLRICNQGTFKYSVAVGYVDRQKGWVAKGWQSLEAGECKDALGFALDNRYYYFFASGQGEHANVKYTGETAFCIETRKFNIYQANYGKSSPEECGKDGLRSEKFVKVDVKGKPDYTINLGVPDVAPSAATTPRQTAPNEPPATAVAPPAAAVTPPAATVAPPAAAAVAAPPAAAKQVPAAEAPTASAEDPSPARQPRTAPQPAPSNSPAAPAAGPNGTACQRYPNLC